MADSKHKLQPAIKKETLRVSFYTAVGLILMFAVFAVLHFFVNENIPFDYKVLLGGVGGGLVAILNFFLMCVTVQQVANTEDDGEARKIMKTSYTKRMGFQLMWMVVAVAAPCFFWAAGLFPLLFPSIHLPVLPLHFHHHYMDYRL